MKFLKFSTLSLGIVLSASALTACSDKSHVAGDGYATANFMSIVNFKTFNVAYAMIDPKVSSNPKNSECLTNIDRDEAIPIYQEYLAKHLSEEELKTADELYGSELGSRINELNEARIEAMGKAVTEGKSPQEVGAIAVAETQPTQEDQAKVEAFLATEVGQKISDLTRGNTYHTDGFIHYTYPLMEKEYEDCNVELESIETLAPLVEKLDQTNYQ